MNQLLDSCSSGVVTLGLKDKAYLLQYRPESCKNATIIELQQSLPKSRSKSETSAALKSPLIDNPVESDKKEDGGDGKKQKQEEITNDIHVVAVATSGEDNSTIHCAVARDDKTLAIYETTAHTEAVGGITKLRPRLVYNTPKRLSSICFTTLEPDSSSTPILIAGDLAGDAYAYGLEDSKQRLLLGHTASMLTGVCVTSNKILTADRDEKIRVSSFPNTLLIEGFLLGHEAYISGVAATKDGAIVITCAGDETIRTWSTETFEQIAQITCSSPKENGEGNEVTKLATPLIPAGLSLSTGGQYLAVIFDNSNFLDLYRVGTDHGDLQLIKRTSCSNQPLGVSFQSENSFHVVLQEPDFVATYKCTDDTVILQSTDMFALLREQAKESKIMMPKTILERDQYGQIKLKKLHETRGPSAGDEPWNRVERVQVAKEANKRHKRRRRENNNGT